MSKLSTFQDYVKMQPPDRNGWCSRCRKKLLVDIGVADDSIPGMWAFCRLCHTFYCPVNFKHVLTQGTVRWRPGRTVHGVARVANCLENTCGTHFESLERVVRELTTYPRGIQAAELMEQWRERAVGSDAWARQAQVIMQFYRFKIQVEPQWKAEERAARLERAVAAEKVANARKRAQALAAAEERAARRAAAEEAAPARWEAYAASGAAFGDSPGDPGFDELMATLLREG